MPKKILKKLFAPIFATLLFILFSIDTTITFAVGIGESCETANCNTGLECIQLSNPTRKRCAQPVSGGLLNNINTSLPQVQNPITPNLQIKLPTLENFSPASCTGTGQNRSCSFPWIGEYISALYKYAIGVIGILAAVVLMIGGLIWLTAGGNQTRVGEAKSYIGASLTGLIIALSSYLILYQINPELTKLKPIVVGMVSEIEGDGGARTFTLTDIDSLGIPSGNIVNVVNSMIGKFTYNQSKRLKTENGINYIDCSSFACTVLIKSGLNAPSPSQCATTNLFKNPTPNVNLNNLTAGTLVGFPPSASSNGAGHVWVSLGGGQFAQARGGPDGRTPGGSINIVNASSITTAMTKYKVKNTYLYP